MSGVEATAATGHPLRWQTLAVNQLAAFMALLDVSIVNVALPSIERGLGVSAGTAQWVVSGYALSFGLALVPAGRLGDALGRRRMFLIALTAFVLTSALTGAAPTIGLLIAARPLQGVAGGMLLPQNSGLIQELFQGAERGRAFGILGATSGLATATGPVVGGLIITLIAGPDAWRWVFYVNVPIGVVALLLAARWIPARSGGGRRKPQMDLIGSLLLGAGVLCLLLPAVDGESNGLGSDWWLFVVAVLLLTAFARWELRTVRRGREPVLDPRLAHTSGFPAGSIIGMVYFIGFTGIWLVLALFYQDGYGYSPLRSGLAVTPFAIGVAVSAAIAGRLVSRFGRVLTVAGPDRDDRRAGDHRAPAAAHRRRHRGVGDRRTLAGRRTRRRHGHLTQRHAVPAARPGTDGRRGGRCPADRSPDRRGDRHRRPGDDLLPRPDELRP
ncbi:MFS transporter [Kribbella pittospori]|uniref:MFS transporter n=1 Tax=Kribbella pittospori TaxID=722689 RepID=UPI00192E2A1B|nr:MFS transporter [Kribbella pittospori]